MELLKLLLEAEFISLTFNGFFLKDRNAPPGLLHHEGCLKKGLCPATSSK